MFCYATCCVEAFILLMWCCVPAFAFEVDDQMLKCVVTGCWKIWLVAESCTYGWEVNHVPCLSQNAITASTSWDSFLGWRRGYWNKIWWGGVFIYLCATGFFFMTCGNLFFFLSGEVNLFLQVSGIVCKFDWVLNGTISQCRNGMWCMLV